MNIIIPDSWLREFLETKATPKQIAKYVSLCGPTVDRLNKVGKDWVYDIEVTTNRVDAMSVMGIAREAAAILPRFGIKAKFRKGGTSKFLKGRTFSNMRPNKVGPSQFRQGGTFLKSKTFKVPPLDIKVVNNPKLCHRILAIKLENVQLGPSPKWMQDRLIKVNQRPLINAIDITNYVMWELGHPIHAFDYDRITKKKIIVREAKKGEKLTTLENEEYILKGGEVVFDNGKGEIIDLPGIMGTANTVVTKNTKNVLLWIESVKAEKIRQASMGLAIRSQAAVLNEKHVDLELGIAAILRGVELFENTTKAKVASKLLDIYPKKPKTKDLKLKKDFIDQRLGVDIPKKDIANFLAPLGFKTKWTTNNLNVTIPTFRAHDMSIPEDIVEEVARIYGYHNLPSKLMDTVIPDKPTDQSFEFENKIRHVLSGLGGSEVYTLSLVPKDYVIGKALQLSNSLGSDSEYLRTSLMKSLIQAAKKNSGVKDPFHLYELANVYLPQKNDLPNEKMMLAGIFSNYDFREAKGVVEALLNKLHTKASQEISEMKGFVPSKRVDFVINGKVIGSFGTLEESGYIYYEFGVETLKKHHVPLPKYKPAPKFPPQIEDITFKLPDKTIVSEVIQMIKGVNSHIASVELTDIFKSAHTFRVHYQHPKKTLNDEEVEVIRKKILKKVKTKFGATV